MRPYCLVVVLCMLCSHGAYAQTTLSLDAALRQAYEKNIDLQRRSAEMMKTQARLEESSRLPNPSVDYSREELVLNNAKAGEWIALGSLPLNFLWERWSDIASKQRSLEAQRELLGHSTDEVVYQVQDAYLKAYYFTGLAAALDSALSILDEIASSARQRTKDGDISEYEFKRILIEVSRLRVAVREAELERNSHLSQLRSLIGHDPTTEVRLAPPPTPASGVQTEKELLRSAMNQRKDLKAVGFLIESESSFLSHRRLKALPALQVSAGYKKQLDQFAGSVFQLSMEIPLFRRNQVDIANTEAELSILERQKELLTRQIASEVQEASARFRQYGNLRIDQGGLDLDDILSTAVYSYRQGDLSLIEFIDGLNAFTEGMKLRTDLDIKYHQSLYQLTKVLGISSYNENK